MTDNEIIKALECCGNIVASTCKGCAYHETYNASCVVRLMRDTVDLINRRQAEIEKLKADKIIAERHEKDARDLFKQTVKQLETAKSEAIKEFAERLTDRICENVNRSLDNPDGNNYYPIDVYKDIDNLAKEMT